MLSWREGLVVKERQNALLREQDFDDLVALLLTQVLVSCHCCRLRSLRNCRVATLLPLALDFLLYIVNTLTQVAFKLVSSLNLVGNLGFDLSDGPLFVCYQHFHLLGFAFILHDCLRIKELPSACRHSSVQLLTRVGRRWWQLALREGANWPHIVVVSGGMRTEAPLALAGVFLFHNFFILFVSLVVLINFSLDFSKLLLQL